ncbi:hypothetical protein M8C21_026412, partial [Ambrosia artemisiifolia]
MKRLRLHRQHPELPRLFVREVRGRNTRSNGFLFRVTTGNGQISQGQMTSQRVVSTSSYVVVQMTSDLEVDMEYLMGLGDLDKERTRVGLVVELEESREG